MLYSSNYPAPPIKIFTEEKISELITPPPKKKAQKLELGQIIKEYRNKLLCENNCTLNNTDFDLERANCLCKYKEVFNFDKRKEEVNDKFNESNYFIPIQNSENAEAIICLFIFTLNQAIIKNEGFY